MSDLRDARLKRALDSAPDADLLPDRQVRQALLDAARKAVTPQPRPAWWERLWQQLGDRHMPWNAALATVLLATLVTVLWHDREVPGAGPGSYPPEAPARAPTPPAAAAPAAQSPATPAPTGTAPPAPAAAPARKSAAAAPQPKPKPAQPSQQAGEPRERRAERAFDVLRDRAGPDLGKGGPAPQSADPSKQAETAAAARAEAPAAAAPAPPPTAAPAPALSRNAPSALASQRELAGDWTHLRIETQGRSIDVAREQAPRLAQLVEGLADAARGQEPLDAPVTVRIELRRGAEAAAVIELAGSQVRWTRARAGRSDGFTARPDPARLEPVREEISRLMQR